MSQTTTQTGAGGGMVTSETPWYVRLLKLQPALVRALLVALAAIVAQVMNKTVVTDETVDLVINVFTALSPLLAGLLIRPAVTPNTKVLAYVPDPVQAPEVAVTGEGAPPEGDDVSAVVGADDGGEVEALPDKSAFDEEAEELEPLDEDPANGSDNELVDVPLSPGEAELGDELGRTIDPDDDEDNGLVVKGPVA